jgi:hypothetical protein
MRRFLCLMVGLGVLAKTSGGTAAESNDSAPALKPVESKSFQIRNKKFGELLRPEDASSADGTRLVLYPAQAWKCMTWKLHPAGESACQLQNHFTSKSFAPDAKTDGTQVAVIQVPFAREAKDRPAWRIVKEADGLCQIIEVKSGKALTAVASDGGGVRVVVAPAGSGDEQKWELIQTDPRKLTM